MTLRERAARSARAGAAVAERLQARARGSSDVERSIVWMLGSPRTGSTWLLNLLRVSPRVLPVDEPGIGSHLGLFAADVMGAHPAGMDAAEMLLAASRAEDDQYFFCTSQAHRWRPALRRLLLDRFAGYLGNEASRDTIIVVKEPAGSQAAGLLHETLPSSRLLFLVRDGRDVIDSELDAVSRGGWLAQLFASDEDFAQGERLGFVRSQAHRWLARTAEVQRAYDAWEPALRFRVRYEDLLDDTTRWLGAILEWLDVPVEPAALRAHVDRLSFGALPEERKGSGKFARAATPGLWRTNLTSEEQQVVRDLLGPTLRALGYPED